MLAQAASRCSTTARASLRASFLEPQVTNTTILPAIVLRPPVASTGARALPRLLDSCSLRATIQYRPVTNQVIHFGTSGWRGIIAEDFTFPGVRRASQAIAGHVREKAKSPVIIVGYDTRFFSEDFARTAATVLRSQICRVFLCGAATPTPVIAHAIIHGKLDGGVNITASHNPAQYNGLKFSRSDGGPALPEITKDIEKRAAKLKDEPGQHHEIEDDFERIDPREPYFEQLRRMIRFDVLRKANGSFVCDALHGCGAGWLDRILAENSIPISRIRDERDVLFEGTGPDPSEENLQPLKKAVAETKAL